MRSLNRDTVCALFLLLFCAVFLWASTGIRDMGYESMDSEVWPQLVLAVLTLLSLIYLLRSVRGPVRDVDDDGAWRPRPKDIGWWRYYANVIGCFVLFGLFLFTLPYLGMLLGGIAFVLATLILLGGGTWRDYVRYAGIAVLTVGGMWALFTYGLHVILPQGELLRLI